MTIAILITIIIILILILWIAIHLLNKQITKLKIRHKQGLSRQSGEVAGKILEKYLPLFEEYPYDIRDVVPIYNTFDFLVLKGRCEGDIEEVIFQEVKTGQSRLTPIQMTLRDCIECGYVQFETWKRDNKSELFYLTRRNAH